MTSVTPAVGPKAAADSGRLSSLSWTIAVVVAAIALVYAYSHYKSGDDVLFMLRWGRNGGKGSNPAAAAAAAAAAKPKRSKKGGPPRTAAAPPSHSQPALAAAPPANGNGNLRLTALPASLLTQPQGFQAPSH